MEELFLEFTNKMSSTEDLFERMDLMYHYSYIINNSHERVIFFKMLLSSYDDILNDINEYKTLLIITKSVEGIEELRGDFLKFYNSL